MVVYIRHGKAMSKYDHSSFLQSPTDAHYLSHLNNTQRQELHEFFATTVHMPTDADSPVAMLMHQFPVAELGHTPNDIFIARRQTADADMTRSPADHYVATCRRIGEHMLHESHEVYDVRYVRSGDRMDKIIELKGATTGQRTVVELAGRALWVELSEAGTTLSYPVSHISGFRIS